MKINEIIRKKRREKEISQTQLAEYANVDQSSISRFESGRGGISSKTLDKLFQILDIDILKLF